MGCSEWPVWSGRWAVENWIIKGMSMWGATLWKSLWEFKGHIKVGHVNVHQKRPLPGSEGDWNKVDLLVCSLEVATCIHEMSGYGGAAAEQRWAECRHILASCEA